MLHGIELPFGRDTRSWWIDESGATHDSPLAEAQALPGRFVLAGLVDAHAHPTVAAGSEGPMVLDAGTTAATLADWARAGITAVRDVGSPGGMTLELSIGPSLPVMQIAGRFLAPPGRYIPDLLREPVEETDLVACALAEVRRGAVWVKVIADFPDLNAGTEATPTYSIEAITRLTTAVHEAGARVAAHSTVSTVGELVAAGVDSIEHGAGLDDAAVRSMARRGTAWTPTLGAMIAMSHAHEMPPDRLQRLNETRERITELLPLAAQLGVPVLAGTDIMGSIPGEVALLAQYGLDPAQALAAASVWPRQFLRLDGASPDIVTYHHDPRDDPDQLATPAAVVMRGVRVR